ncbi:type I toxin-antitoxin system Fst family toxin [Listeria monocytogenes]|nr:type I toxin-antitoxin system Fst family toxin [Listeria monocytogenes]
MSILFSSIIAPVVVGCAIVFFKHILEDQSNNKSRRHFILIPNKHPI